MKKCNRVLFVERSGELRRAARRKARTPTSEGKPSLKRAESHAAQTRSVEKGGDEVWVGEKFQSNPEIAGSPRNSFRASLCQVCRR